MADDFTTVEAAKITDLLLDQPQLAADLLRNDLKNAGSPQAQLALIGKIIAAQPADDTGTLVIGPIQQDGCGGPGTRSVAITYPGSDGAPVAEQIMTLQTRSMPCDQNGQPIATSDLPPAAPVVPAPGYDAGQAPPPPDAGYPLQNAGVPPAYYGSQDYVPYGANSGYGAYAFSPYGMDDCYVEGAFIIGGNGMGMGGWGNRAWLGNQNRISQQYAQTYAPQNTSTIGNGAITQPGTTQNPGNGAIQQPGTNGSTVGNGSMQHITAPVTNKFYNTTNNYVTDTTNKNNTYVTIDKSHTTTIVNGNHDKVNDTIVRMPATPAQPGHPQPGPIERTPPVAKPVPVAPVGPAPIEKPPVAKPAPAGPAPIEQHPPGTPRPGFPPPGNQQGAPPREIHPPVPPPAAPQQGAPRDNTHPTPAAGPTPQQLEQQHLLQQQEQQRIKTQQDQQHQQQLQNQQRQDLQRQQQERQPQPIQHPAAPPRPVAAPPPRPAAAPPPRPAAAPPRPAAPPPHH